MTIFVMNYIVMKEFGLVLKNIRKSKSLKINQLARLTGIDASLISRYESGDRMPNDKQLITLSQAMSLNYEEIRKQYVTAKVVQILAYEPHAEEILIAAEQRIEYLSQKGAAIDRSLDHDINEQLERISHLRSEWQRQKPLNATQLDKMKSYFNVEYTYESNRIEGNTLTLKETELVVNQGLTISGKSMTEHLEAINHSEASDYIMDLAVQNNDLDKRTLLELHGLILKSIDREHAGAYRTVNVRIAGSEHIPPEHFKVSELMDDYFRFYIQNQSRLHPVILAAEMHERLVSIHPFVDGNGRTARLVMNLILLRNGYTIANLKGDLPSRLKYYNTLEEVQMNNNPQEFYRFILDAVELSLNRHLELT